ncbi:MAG: HAMP domain-containing histidine kinase [Spirochaetales bacterium]|nr:MAG: HAMP domain-containing histidine kinase [Spirochaetales bacterium]
MKTRIQEKAIFAAALASFILMIASFFAFYMRKSESQNRTLLEFEASRAASDLLEYYVMTGNVEGAAAGEQILGFGIYDASGQAVAKFGTAPPVVNPGTSPAGVIRTGKSVIIMRPVGRQPGMMRGMGPMRMHQNAPGLTSMMPAQDLFVYVEFSNRGFLRERSASIFSMGGFFSGFLLLSLVIFYLFRRNRKLQVKAEEQKQLLQLGEAARTLAHEIKNPLSALRLQVDILKKKSAGRFDDNVEIVEQEVGRLSSLVDRVGEFLKNPAGLPEVFSPAGFLENICPRYPFPVILDTGAGAEDSGGARIRFDRERFRSLCDNLILNAWESMAATGENGKKVEVEVRTEKNQVLLMVKDRGCGIPEDRKDEIFTMFYTTKTSGSGIGLAISRRFMEAMGGTITCLPRNGGGTVFACEFLRA